MNRRTMIKQAALSSLTLISLTSFAQAAPVCKKQKTPIQPEGPFYPVNSQLDTDSDLIQLSGSNKVADGEIIYIKGIVTDQFCKPVSGVLVEIWQACKSGKYNHPSDPNTAKLDPYFQYWGKAVTNLNGEYTFRTIIPGAYPADTNWIRPPHIHFKISRHGYLELITQMYFSGNKYNTADKILKKLSLEQQKNVIVELKKSLNDLQRTANFNIEIEKI